MLHLAFRLRRWLVMRDFERNTLPDLVDEIGPDASAPGAPTFEEFTEMLNELTRRKKLAPSNHTIIAARVRFHRASNEERARMWKRWLLQADLATD